jgi:hypothetical protein
MYKSNKIQTKTRAFLIFFLNFDRKDFKNQFRHCLEVYYRFGINIRYF